MRFTADIQTPFSLQSEEVKPPEVSLKEMGEWALFGGAVEGAIGLVGGGYQGAAAGLVKGAVEGALAYLMGKGAAMLAFTLGAGERGQFLAELIGNSIVPLNVGKVRGLFKKAPTVMKYVARNGAAALAGGYLGWSASDEDPRLGATLGALGVGLGVGLLHMFDVERVAKVLANKVAEGADKLPFFSVREIPELYVKGKGELGGFKEQLLGKAKAIGVREAVLDALTDAIGKSYESRELMRTLKEAGLSVDDPFVKDWSRKLMYGVSKTEYQKMVRELGAKGEALDAWVRLVAEDTGNFIELGLLKPDIASAFTFIAKDMDFMKVHVPVVLRTKGKVEELAVGFMREPKATGMTRFEMLREKGVLYKLRSKLAKRVLEQLGKKSSELKPGEILRFLDLEENRVRSFTVVEYRGKKMLHEHFSEKVYEKLIKRKVEKGELPEGSILEPNVVAGAIKYVSERTQLYKRAVVMRRIEQLLETHGLVSESPTAVHTVRIRDTVLSDMWGIRAFGNLNGKYVPKEVARLLENLHELLAYRPGGVGSGLWSKLIKRWSLFQNVWKKLYLGLNFKSYLYQGISNTILTLASGLNPAEIVKKGVEGLMDPVFRHGLEHLGGRGIGIAAEMVEDSFRYVKGRLVPRTKLEGAFQAINWLGDKLISAFGFTDDLFRAGLVKYYTDEFGLTMREAIRKAQDILPHYEMLPAGIRSLRDTIWPFISFSYVILPKIATQMLRHPETYLGILTLIEAMQVAGWQEMYGENWREGRRFEQLVNEHYMKPTVGAFLADYIRVPSISGIPNGYISAAFLPWNLPLSIPAVHEATSPSFWLSMFLLQSPWVRTISALAFDVDPATGRQISTYAGAGRSTWESVTQWAIRNLVPSPLISRWTGHMLAKEGWFSPLTAWFNCFGVDFAGRPYQLEQVLWNMILPTIVNYDPTFKADMEIRRIQTAIEDHKTALIKLLYRGASGEALEKSLQELAEFEAEKVSEAGAILEAYAKGLGKRQEAR